MTSDEAKTIQSAVGVTADGIIGPQTIKALQGKVGVSQDGQLGPQTIAALQSKLTSGDSSVASAVKALIADYQSGKRFTVGGKNLVKIDMHKMGIMIIGIAAAGFIAFAVSSGKLGKHA
jgi:lysozyme family protein